MLAGFVVHAFTYVAVCGLLTAIWALVGRGSPEELERIIEDPTLARDLGFWPIWVILGWGTAVVIHLGTVVAEGVFGAPGRHRRRVIARQATKAAVELTERAVAAKRGGRYSSGRPPATSGGRRWVTVMFTDIANSTSLNEELGDDTWSGVLGRHREFVRSAMVGRGGEVVGTQGDGFLARFPTPADAVLCGVDIQRQLSEVLDDTGLELKVRIGIHAGEAVEDEDGDLIGRVVNLASRVTSEAEPGEILVTEPVADFVGDGLTIEDRGLRPLRGVAQPRHLLAVRWGEADRSASSSSAAPG